MRFTNYQQLQIFPLNTHHDDSEHHGKHKEHADHQKQTEKHKTPPCGAEGWHHKFGVALGGQQLKHANQTNNYVVKAATIIDFVVGLKEKEKKKGERKVCVKIMSEFGRRN